MWFIPNKEILYNDITKKIALASFSKILDKVKFDANKINQRNNHTWINRTYCLYNFCHTINNINYDNQQLFEENILNKLQETPLYLTQWWKIISKQTALKKYNFKSCINYQWIFNNVFCASDEALWINENKWVNILKYLFQFKINKNTKQYEKTMLLLKEFLIQYEVLIFDIKRNKQISLDDFLKEDFNFEKMTNNESSRIYLNDLAFAFKHPYVKDSYVFTYVKYFTNERMFNKTFYSWVKFPIVDIQKEHWTKECSRFFITLWIVLNKSELNQIFFNNILQNNNVLDKKITKKLSLFFINIHEKEIIQVKSEKDIFIDEWTILKNNTNINQSFFKDEYWNTFLTNFTYLCPTSFKEAQQDEKLNNNMYLSNLYSLLYIPYNWPLNINILKELSLKTFTSPKIPISFLPTEIASKKNLNVQVNYVHSNNISLTSSQFQHFMEYQYILCDKNYNILLSYNFTDLQNKIKSLSDDNFIWLEQNYIKLLKDNIETIDFSFNINNSFIHHYPISDFALLQVWTLFNTHSVVNKIFNEFNMFLIIKHDKLYKILFTPRAISSKAIWQNLIKLINISKYNNQMIKRLEKSINKLNKIHKSSWIWTIHPQGLSLYSLIRFSPYLTSDIYSYWLVSWFNHNNLTSTYTFKNKNIQWVLMCNSFNKVALIYPIIF